MGPMQTKRKIIDRQNAYLNTLDWNPSYGQPYLGLNFGLTVPKSLIAQNPNPSLA